MTINNPRTALKLLNSLDYPTFCVDTPDGRQLISEYNEKMQWIAALKHAIKENWLKSYTLTRVEGNLEHKITLKSEAEVYFFIEPYKEDRVAQMLFAAQKIEEAV